KSVGIGADGGASAGVANQQLKFNGIVRIGDQVSVGIEDVTQKKSYLIGVGKTEEGIEIKEFNERNDTVLLSYNGQLMAPLPLEKSFSAQLAGISPVSPMSPGMLPPPTLFPAQPGGAPPDMQSGMPTPDLNGMP